jgi:predicted nuclease of predicted toxin-antitoxin system
MNFLVDVHLPIRLSKFLDNQPGCSSIHVNQILRKWLTTDLEICRYADEHNLVVITKDADFKASHFVNNIPKKIIRIVLGNISNAELLLLFEKHLAIIANQDSKTAFYIEFSKETLSVFYP